MYKTGRIKLAATKDELGEIKVDDGGAFINYGIDDINEDGMKRWRKRGLLDEDRVSFRINKDGFAFDIIPSGVRGIRKVKGKSI